MAEQAIQLNFFQAWLTITHSIAFHDEIPMRAGAGISLCLRSHLSLL
jgi:hypothetical protein